MITSFPPPNEYFSNAHISNGCAADFMNSIAPLLKKENKSKKKRRRLRINRSMMRESYEQSPVFFCTRALDRPYS